MNGCIIDAMKRGNRRGVKYANTSRSSITGNGDIRSLDTWPPPYSRNSINTRLQPEGLAPTIVDRPQSNPMLTIKKGLLLFLLVVSEGAVSQTPTPPPGTLSGQDCPKRFLSSESEVNVPVDGIDVSRYQGKFVSFAEASVSKVRFVFIKATEGSHLVDRYFVAHVAQARAACIPFGIYHFYDPRIPYEDQLEHFLKTVPTSYIDLPPVVDVEKAPAEGLAVWKRGLAAFLKGVESHYNTIPLIYTGSAFARQHFAGAGLDFERYPLWLAEYPSKKIVLPTSPERPPAPVNPWTRWHFWQYTEDCRVDGVAGLAGCSRFHGGYDQLEALRFGRQPR